MRRAVWAMVVLGCGPGVREHVEPELALVATAGVRFLELDGGAVVWTDEPTQFGQWSPDGRFFAYVVSASDGGLGVRLLVLDVDAEAVIAETDGGLPLAWDPAGERIAFARGWGDEGLSILDVRDGSTRALTPSGVPVWGIGWSPDGTRLSIRRDLGEYMPKSEIVDVATGGVTRVTDLEDHVEEELGVFTADGRWIVVPMTLALRAYGPTGEEILVDEGYRYEALGSPEGSQMLYRAWVPNDAHVVLADLDAGTRIEVDSSDFAARWWDNVAWSEDRARVAFEVDDGEEQTEVFVMEMATLEKRRVGGIEVANEIAGLCWAGDGERIAALAWVQWGQLPPGENNKSEVHVIEVGSGEVGRVFAEEGQGTWGIGCRPG